MSKILMIIRKYNGVGGHDIAINNLCEKLNKIGHDVYIGAFSFSKHPPNNIKTINLSKLDLFSKTIDGITFDIIHSHETLLNYFSLFNKSNFLFHYHGINGMLQKINLIFSLYLCRNSLKQIISVSKTATCFLKKYSKIPIHTISNGVDTNFYNSYLEQKYKKGNPQFLFVGNLYPNKNTEQLIDIFNEIKNVYPSCHLQIVGDGDDYKKLQNKIKNMNLRDTVELVGRLEKEQLRFYYSSCDIYISASKLEANPIPVLEALSCGKPVLLSNILAHDEILKSSNGGLSFSTNNISEIIEKIKLIIENTSFYKNNALKYIKNNDWSIVCERISTIYGQILK